MPPSSAPGPHRVPFVAMALGVLALLVLGGAGAVLAQDGNGSDTAPVGVQPESADGLALPERVVLTGPQSQGSAVVGPDASTALERGGSDVAGVYRRHLLEEELAAATGEEERRAVINDTAADLAIEIEQLRERERAARSAYRTGTVSDREYVAALAGVDAQAGEIESVVSLIEPVGRQQGLAEQAGATDASTTLRAVQGDLTASAGPVRSAAGEAFSGSAEPRRVSITAAENGTVLASIVDDAYHREAVRSDLVVGGDEQGMSLSEAFRLTESTLYPSFSSNYGFSGIREEVPNQYYRAGGSGDPTYEHGALQTYIDAVSRNAFWEYQRLALGDGLPLGSPITNDSAVLVDGNATGAVGGNVSGTVDGNDTDDDGADDGGTNETSNGATQNGVGEMTLSVRPTYSTGPASVTVTSDGIPVRNATIVVDDVPVAQTDGTGQAWVVLPGSSPVVSVTVDGRRLTVPVNW